MKTEIKPKPDLSYQETTLKMAMKITPPTHTPNHSNPNRFSFLSSQPLQQPPLDDAPGENQIACTAMEAGVRMSAMSGAYRAGITGDIIQD